MTDNLFSIEVHYTGRVQGVGFRYQTLQVAHEFMVNGEVKNLSDGRVFMCAEGQEAEVLAFQKELEDRMKHFIREVEVKTAVGTSRYKGFRIT